MNNLTAKEEQRILIRFNFPAPVVTSKAINDILSHEKNEFSAQWILWLEDFFGLPKASFTSDLLDRFCEANTKQTFMNVVPSIEKLLKPLKDSCRSYCFGLYSASIALSGVVLDSLQILLWEMQGLKIKNAELTKKQTEIIFGKSFERIESARRIQILHTFSWITDSQKDDFERIRNIRNRYIHPWRASFKNEKTESLECYRIAFRLFREITAVKIKDAGSIEVNPLLIKWMNKQKW